MDRQVHPCSPLIELIDGSRSSPAPQRRGAPILTFDKLIDSIEEQNGSKNLKIGIFISQYLNYEGASRVAEHQAICFAKRAHDVTVVAFEADITPKNYKIVTIKPLVPAKNPLVGSVFRGTFGLNFPRCLVIAQKFRDLDWIIVHQQTLISLAYLCKKLHGAGTIYWHHHIQNPDIEEASPLDRLYFAGITPINWMMVERFDRVVSVSNFSRLDMLKSYGIDSTVIYNSVTIRDENEELPADGAGIRDRYFLGAGPFILFVGRIVPHKNIHTLIRIFDLVRTSIPDVKLVLVGKEENKEYFNSLCKDHDGTVVFTGYLPDAELLQFYRECSVYATCSLLEGFNIPLVEAQKWGKSAIAFDIGPHREVMRRGVLIEPGDVERYAECLTALLRAITPGGATDV